MRTCLSIVLILLGLALLAVLAISLLTPWMDRWGATSEEIQSSLPGDELVPEPKVTSTRAITIRADPAHIYPWLVQLGADKGGLYSYAWLENLAQCPIVNADRLHPEWQNLQVGDQMKLCPGADGPPPYEVAQILPGQALVFGHQDAGTGQWAEVWQFTLQPQMDGTTRLVVRSRTMMDDWFWKILHPISFMMERGMLRGIRQRAEVTDLIAPLLPTSTPEVFNPLNPSPTPSGSTLPLNCQVTDLQVHIEEDGYCFAYPQGFSLKEDVDSLVILGPALGSPVESFSATFSVEVRAFDPEKSLTQQVDAYLADFTTVDPQLLVRASLRVSGEEAILVEAIPVQFAWRIIFLQHVDQLYLLKYWPVDVPEAKADLDTLYQTTLNTFSFTR